MKARLADEMARELEGVAEQSHAAPRDGFTDRVMASISREPLPQPARAFGAAVGGRRLGAALASIGDAWRVAFGGRAPLAVRAQALALVLIVAAGSLAVAGGATVGAIDLLNATPPHSPSPTVPEPSEPPSLSPSPSPSPSLTTPDRTTEPGPTSDATETPEATGTSGGGTDIGTPQPTRTDDHGGGSGEHSATPTPAGTNDHGGDGSGSGGETPKPTGTNDHGGGGDG